MLEFGFSPCRLGHLRIVFPSFLLYCQLMSSFGKLVVVAALALGFAAGCSPNDADQLDEEREPHFVLGNNEFNAMNYPAAIEAFEQSLEVNPHSAKAHYRLAQLFDTKEPDMAAAIYHYQEYLRLDPQADNKDLINQRINTCKQQLAADVLQLPSAPSTVKTIETLTETNRVLQQKVDELTRLVQQWKDYSDNLQAQQARQPQVAAYRGNPASGQTDSAGNPMPDDTTVPAPGATDPTPPRHIPASGSGATSAHPPKSHTHIVAAGETMAGIARKLGITTAALESANPTVSPKHLHVGQTLYLPPGT
jgi:LysM repeat protein